MERIFGEWKEIGTYGYTGPVSDDDGNPAAHGGCCVLDCREVFDRFGQRIGEYQMRHTNVNGRHVEEGEPKPATKDVIDLFRRLRA